MDSTNNSGKSIVVGMLILALSGLLLGAVGGYFGSHYLLEKYVLNNMMDDGYVSTAEATATADDILNGKTAYVNGQMVTGTIEAFDTSDATATSDVIVKGKTAYVDGQLVVGTLPTMSGSDITPKSDPTTITGGYYLTSNIVIKGDYNLVAKNIRNGVVIFGVRGSFTPGYEEAGQ